MHRVFVYGTLKKGYGNNRLLMDSALKGTALTCDEYDLRNCGFPYLIKESLATKRQVVGEVWEVDDATLERLDRLEGVKYNHYDRVKLEVELEGEKIEVYGYQASKDTAERGAGVLPVCNVTEEGYYEWAR